MTEQDKDILIGKMIDSPSSLTDEELDMILTDDELRDIYEISTDVKGACIRQPEMDAEHEWRLFRRRILPRPSPMKWIMRGAAVFLGVTLVAGILVKVTDGLFTEGNKPVVADVGKRLNPGTPDCDGLKDSSSADSGPRSDVSAAERSAPPVASPVQYKKSGKTANKAKEEEEIDVDEYLRQQQAEIDREIALLNAEIYIDEQNAMREFMEYLNGDDTDKADANIILQ